MAGHGGHRKGSGRPKGTKDKTPRLKRTDVLNANREKWAEWSQHDGLLKKVRKRLGEIVDSPDSSNKDAILASKLLLEYDVGRPSEAKEVQPAQPLQIFLTAPDGGYTQLEPGRKPIDLEVTDEGNPRSVDGDRA